MKDDSEMRLQDVVSDAGSKADLERRVKQDFNEHRSSASAILGSFSDDVTKSGTSNSGRQFDHWEIVRLTSAGCPMEIARQYNARFNGLQIAKLFELGIDSRTIDSYSDALAAEDIAKLVWANVPPEFVKDYVGLLDSTDISKVYVSRNSGDAVAAVLCDLLHSHVMGFRNKLDLWDPDKPLLKLVNDGLEQGVILKNNSAQIFSDNLEYQIFSVRYRCFTPTSRAKGSYVLQANQLGALWDSVMAKEFTELRRVRVSGVDDLSYQILVIIDYLSGNSLDALISRGKCSIQKAFQYGQDIFNALKALHKSSLVHGDLHPINILINSENDRALLTDFNSCGEAEVVPQNRRYYAADSQYGDLVSFGMVLYKMCTGEDIFDIFSTLAFSSGADVSEFKNWIYSDPHRLNQYLSKVDVSVHNASLAEIIKICFTAKDPSVYKELEKRFEYGR